MLYYQFIWAKYQTELILKKLTVQLSNYKNLKNTHESEKNKNKKI